MLAPTLAQIKAGQVSADRLGPMFDELAQGLMLNYDGSYLGDDGEPALDEDNSNFDGEKF